MTTPSWDEIRGLLEQPAFPRTTAGYDAEWVLEHQMGPNPLWLVEWLSQALDLQPGDRVLDLGCGKALTSIFLAKELDARVWACDLWIGPDNNWRRVTEAGVADKVCPLRAEAHALPFAQGFFDAVVSIDAYHYFGTDELYLNHLAGFVRPGGKLGVVVPGLTAEIDGPPAHLLEPQANGKVFWEDECRSFKAADWWRRHWSSCDRVTDVETSTLQDGWRLWRDFEHALERSGKGLFPSDAEALERDQGRTMGFVRVTATRTEQPTLNAYDPALGAKFGVDR